MRGCLDSSPLNSPFETDGRTFLLPPPADVAPQPPTPKVFIVSWLDYCNKYGMGYALTDGSVGVHFNDSTSIILAPDKECVPAPSLPTARSLATVTAPRY